VLLPRWFYCRLDVTATVMGLEWFFIQSNVYMIAIHFYFLACFTLVWAIGWRLLIAGNAK